MNCVSSAFWTIFDSLPLSNILSSRSLREQLNGFMQDIYSKYNRAWSLRASLVLRQIERSIFCWGWKILSSGLIEKSKLLQICKRILALKYNMSWPEIHPRHKYKYKHEWWNYTCCSDKKTSDIILLWIITLLKGTHPSNIPPLLIVCAKHVSQHLVTQICRLFTLNWRKKNSALVLH